MSFFAKPLSDLLSQVKSERGDSLGVLFRKKYSLAPTDPRYLNATYEDILKDWLEDQVSENPNLRIEDLMDRKKDDEAWMASQEQEIVVEKIKEKFKKYRDDDFEIVDKETRS